MSSKAVSLDMIMSSASTRVDGSLGIRFQTPELSPSEKTVVFELLNRTLRVIIQPTDMAPESIVEVKKTLGFKSPSQQLRSIMYIEWKQKNPDMLFNEYYDREMNIIIEKRKANLEPE